MGRIIGEYLGLLNRMYEGLIVLRKEDLKSEFASKPALDIFKSSPSAAEISSKS